MILEKIKKPNDIHKMGIFFMIWDMMGYIRMM